MKEFITDLLQKTNQAKYNLMKQQVTLIYTTDFLSPTPETQDSKMIIETSTNPNNASFYSIDKNMYKVSKNLSKAIRPVIRVKNETITEAN